MRPPFSLYGGKQIISNKIIKLIPTHNLYVEVFAGSSSIFWIKKPSKKEILNDLDFDIINFNRCLKYYQNELCCVIYSLSYNAKTFRKCFDFLKNPCYSDKPNIRRAAAYWFCQNASFSSIGTSIGSFDRAFNKKDWINQDYKNRLFDVELFNCDFIDIITTFDSSDTFFYVDPPYYNATQHYKYIFDKDKYIQLLDTLSNIRGKFILSGYPSFLLHNLSKINKWQSQKAEMSLSAARAVGCSRNKIEELTWNY